MCCKIKVVSYMHNRIYGWNKVSWLGDDDLYAKMHDYPFCRPTMPKKDHIADTGVILTTMQSSTYIGRFIHIKTLPELSALTKTPQFLMSGDHDPSISAYGRYLNT